MLQGLECSGSLLVEPEGGPDGKGVGSSVALSKGGSSIEGGGNGPPEWWGGLEEESSGHRVAGASQPTGAV